MAERILTTAAFSAIVMDKKDLYELATRNGFYLPSLKSGACTEDYLINVVKGGYWCLKYQDVKMLPCPRPPSKDILIKKYIEGSKAKGHQSIYISKDRRPDVKWLLDAVATLLPGDEIFKKGYVPPPKRKRLQDYKTIALPQDLFDGMPSSKSKAKRRGLKILSEGLVMEKVERLKQVRTDVGIALLDHEMRLDELKRLSKPNARDQEVEEEKKHGQDATDVKQLKEQLAKQTLQLTKAKNEVKQLKNDMRQQHQQSADTQMLFGSGMNEQTPPKGKGKQSSMNRSSTQPQNSNGWDPVTPGNPVHQNSFTGADGTH